VGVLILLFLGYARSAVATRLALSLVAAGALGNAIDRIGRGYVIDYLDLGPGLWPVLFPAEVPPVPVRVGHREDRPAA